MTHKRVLGNLTDQHPEKVKEGWAQIEAITAQLNQIDEVDSDDSYGSQEERKIPKEQRPKKAATVP